jgi:autotransporter-associated beta strand protein
MPSWNGAVTGNWNDSANWSGGVPNSVGALASFFISNSPSIHMVTLAPNQETIVGSIYLGATAAGGLTLTGTNSTLVFNNGGIAEITTSTSPGGANLAISGALGLKMRLDNSIIVDIQNVGTIASFGAQISGIGSLTKIGVGQLHMANVVNTFSGGIFVNGGTLYAFGDNALSTGAISIANNAIFKSLNVVDNAFATVADATGTAGAAQIVAVAGSTLTLTGSLNHASRGTLSFGSLTDNGTIVARFATIGENAVDSSFRINAGTLQLDNAYNAANLFAHPGAGTTKISAGAILDTMGFVTTISNLDMDGGTIRTSTGALRLSLTDISAATIAQSGTLEGTAGIDQLTINVENGFSLQGLTITSWSNSDYILINGSGNANIISGSARAEEINGFAGNDLLSGFGGADTINGGDGDDTIYLNNLNGGSVVSGGTGADTLDITGSLASISAISGFEVLTMNGGANVIVGSGAFVNGFSSSATISGAGSIFIESDDLVTTLLPKLMTVTAGSNITFSYSGGAGVDIFKSNLNATNLISTGAGTDLIQGGNLADTINGGNDADKIAGNGGADTLIGGTGADVFKFRNVADSGTGLNADTITDFLTGTDRLNFARIDTTPGLVGDQAFTYIGTATFNTNGVAKIRYTDLGADLRVEADVNGDGVADMHILLVGAGAGTLSAADFVL